LSDLVVEVTSGIVLHEQFEKYPSTLVELEKEDGKFGWQVKWIWLADEDKGKGEGENGEDRKIFDWTPLKVTPRNKSGKRISSLRGQQVDEGEAINLSQFLGIRANLIFEHYKAEDGTTREKLFGLQPIA
jgi:hypothetical protein